MSYQSGPCSEEPVELPEPIAPKRNVTPPSDDEQPVEMWGGATHFHPYLVNQREYPRRPRGTARD